MGLLTPVILRETLNSGKLASGAKIYFYKTGTSTPATVYGDYAETVACSNPVVCDASGWPGAIYGSSTYRIWITDANDVQIVPAVDGLNSGANAESTIAVVDTYADVRALTAGDVVYVKGRESAGDGGQGLFALIANGTDVDDGGIALVAPAGEYKRIYGSYIDPEWYGLIYNASADQTATLIKVLNASVKWLTSAIFTGPVYITQNITFPAHSNSTWQYGSYLQANNAVTATIASGAFVDIKDILFGANVSPLFMQQISAIKLSWMGGSTDDVKLTKLFASTSQPNQLLMIDKSISIANQNLSCSLPIAFGSGAIITTTGTLSTMTWNMPNIILPANYCQLFAIGGTVTTYNFNFGINYMSPFHFGAKDVYLTLQTPYINLAGAGGYLDLSNYTFYARTGFNSFSNLHITGPGTLVLDGVPLSVSNELSIINDAVITQEYTNYHDVRAITAQNKAQIYITTSTNFTTEIKSGYLFELKSADLSTSYTNKTALSDGYNNIIFDDGYKSAIIAGNVLYCINTSEYHTIESYTDYLPATIPLASDLLANVSVGDTFAVMSSNLKTTYGTITATVGNIKNNLQFSTSDWNIAQVGRVLYCSYNQGKQSWTSPASIIARDSTMDSRINAVSNNVAGVTFSDKGQYPVLAAPYLYGASLPLIKGANVLGTSSTGLFQDVGATYSLVAGTDYSYELINLTGPKFDAVECKLRLLGGNIAILNFVINAPLTLKSVGIASSTNASYIEITPISAIASKWFAGSIINGRITEIYESQSSLSFNPCQAPQSVFSYFYKGKMQVYFGGKASSLNDGFTFGFGDYYMQNNGSPMMQWTDIFPAYSQTTLMHRLGFSAFIALA